MEKQTLKKLVVHCKRESYDVYIGRLKEKQTVVNMHWQHDEIRKAKLAGRFVRIDRATKWGNPFSHLPGKADCQVPTREDAVECYRRWILTQPDLLQDLHELQGKVLGCWCAPKACHGDILAELAAKDA